LCAPVERVCVVVGEEFAGCVLCYAIFGRCCPFNCCATPPQPPNAPTYCQLAALTLLPSHLALPPTLVLHALARAATVQVLNSIVFSCVRVGYTPWALIEYAESRGYRLAQPPRHNSRRAQDHAAHSSSISGGGGDSNGSVGHGNTSVPPPPRAACTQVGDVLPRSYHHAPPPGDFEGDARQLRRWKAGSSANTSSGGIKQRKLLFAKGRRTAQVGGGANPTQAQAVQGRTPTQPQPRHPAMRRRRGTKQQDCDVEGGREVLKQVARPTSTDSLGLLV
jgi:hypothetical protein